MAGMVQKRGLGHWLTHLGLIIGVLIIFFPIWLAFVASTVTNPEIVRPPQHKVNAVVVWHGCAE